MDTLNLHSHFENLLYVGRSVLTNTSSRIRRLFFKDSVNIASYINYCNSNFEYNKALDKWIMPDGYLGLFIPTDDFEKRFAFVQTLV